MKNLLFNKSIVKAKVALKMIINIFWGFAHLILMISIVTILIILYKYLHHKSPGMQTIFDQVQSDYLILSIAENVTSLGAMILTQISNHFNEKVASVICLIVYCSILANMIHLCTACLTRLASICLIGTIEEFNDRLVILGTRLFVLLLTSTFVSLEIWFGGVGTILLYNSLTNVPINLVGRSGFSKVVLIGVTVTLVSVVTITQTLVSWERMKMRQQQQQQHHQQQQHQQHVSSHQQHSPVKYYICSGICCLGLCHPNQDVQEFQPQTLPKTGQGEDHQDRSEVTIDAALTQNPVASRGRGRISFENILLLESVKSKKSLEILIFMIFAVSFTFIVFMGIFRKDHNLLIPLALIFQSLSFLITPLIIIRQNPNLRSFANSSFNTTIHSSMEKRFHQCSKICSDNDVHPFVIVL